MSPIPADTRVPSLLNFERRGGLAGFDERLELLSDNRASLQRGSAAPREFQITAAQREQLEGLIATTRAPLAKAAPGEEPGADQMLYRLTIAGQGLVCAAEDLPEGLRPLVDVLEGLLAAHPGA